MTQYEIQTELKRNDKTITALRAMLYNAKILHDKHPAMHLHNEGFVRLAKYLDYLLTRQEALLMEVRDAS